MATNVFLALLCLTNAHFHSDRSLLEDHNHQNSRCGTDEYMADKIASDPEYKKRIYEIEANYEELLASGKIGLGRLPWNDVLEIPVVLHIIWNTPQQNINYEQIMSQMVVMNEDFMKLNEDWMTNTPSEWIPIVANYSMVYKLSEIKRVETFVEVFDLTDDDGHYIDAMKRSIDGGSDYVAGPVLNIWICQCSGVLGYATWPGYPEQYDGVVMLTQAFGSTNYDYSNSWGLTPSFDLGRTATHEIGHFLWLAHVWGDGDCTASDYVSDTPLMEGPSFGCPDYPQYSCGSTDMTMNFMDYVDDECYSMFTNGQFERSQSLMYPGGAREELMHYVNDGILPFVASIYFQVGNLQCGPGDATVRDTDGSVLNLNDGHIAPHIKACISKTINKYVLPISDIAVVIGSECSMDYFIDTNLNYQVPLSQEVHVCFNKGTDIEGSRITDITFFSFDEEQINPNYNGYKLILTNVNGRIGDLPTPSYIYLGYTETETVIISAVNGDNNNDDDNYDKVSNSETIAILFGLIVLFLLTVFVVYYHKNSTKSNKNISMEYEMETYGTVEAK